MAVSYGTTSSELGCQPLILLGERLLWGPTALWTVFILLQRLAISPFDMELGRLNDCRCLDPQKLIVRIRSVGKNDRSSSVGECLKSMTSYGGWVAFPHSHGDRWQSERQRETTRDSEKERETARKSEDAVHSDKDGWNVKPTDKNKAGTAAVRLVSTVGDDYSY